MTRIDYKSQNREYQYRMRDIARTIAEKYPEIEGVKIEVVLDFRTAICPTKPEVYKFTVKPDHKIHLYYDYLNRDCTGSDFDLTSVLEDCLRNKNEVQGILYCNGKEDAKYAHTSGCSCMTTCTYKFMAVVK